ncbi:MAG: SMP-30/gluconolactonase/LRE family protein [Pirellulales bacterium]|nr:SMP-30/gluconolactonase/LRE family protein [Pirellulales bacterium]
MIDTILAEIPDEIETRFNDVVADPEGRVFCGTMPTNARPGRLYRFNLDGSYDVIVEGIGCPNGMGFTVDLKQMYFTDSTEHVIWICAYDRTSGSLGDRREFARTEPPVMPDGLTVDADGNIWSAQWNGARVVCYSQNGQTRHEIELPTSRITSLVFGGPDFEDLYVTSASDDEKTTEQQPLAGSLFRIRNCSKGQPEFVSRIGLADRPLE